MTVTLEEKLGFQVEKKVLVEVRRWESLQRLCSRMKSSFGFVESEAKSLLSTCRHIGGCPGKDDLSAQCLRGCPDRELRLSALVMLRNALEFRDVQMPKMGGPWMPPTREHFDQLVGELIFATQELSALKSSAATQSPPRAPWWRRLLDFFRPRPAPELPAIVNGLQSKQDRDIESVREAIVTGCDHEENQELEETE